MSLLIAGLNGDGDDSPEDASPGSSVNDVYADMIGTICNIGDVAAGTTGTLTAATGVSNSTSIFNLGEVRSWGQSALMGGVSKG